MITLINPPGLKTFSGLNMHTPNPPLGLAYIAGTLRSAGYGVSVIDAVGEKLERITPFEYREDLLVQGLDIEEIVERVDPLSNIIGVTCTFSTFWPLARDTVHALRQRFPSAFIILGGEHGTAVPEDVLCSSEVDVVILGEGEETIVNLIEALDSKQPLSEVGGIAYLDQGTFRTTMLSPRNRDIDSIPVPAWDLFPIDQYIDRHQINGMNIGRSMPLLATRGCPYQCTFCSSPNMWTTRYIPSGPDPCRRRDRVLQEKIQRN